MRPGGGGGVVRGLALEEDEFDDFSTHTGGAGEQRRPGVGRTPHLSQQPQEHQHQQQGLPQHVGGLSGTEFTCFTSKKV